MKRAIITIAFLFNLIGCEENTIIQEVDCNDTNNPVLCGIDTEYVETFDTPPSQWCKGVLMFSDPAVEKAVRLEAGKAQGDLYYKNVAEITVLEVFGQSSNLQGIHCLSSLTKLDITDFYGIDINPIGELQNLMDVRIFAQNTSNTVNYNALTGLNNLYKVELSGNIQTINMLTANNNLGQGDTVRINSNNSNLCNNEQSNITELQSRGVSTEVNCY